VPMRLLPGSPSTLGSTWDGEGVNFAIYSENATEVELCLFDEAGAETRQTLPNKTAFVWHGYVPGLAPGQRYGYRVHGPYEPKRGLRFNPHIVLLDPYAQAVDGVERWAEGCFAYDPESPEQDLTPTGKEQLGAPRGVIIDPHFDWEGDEPLRTPLHRSVIYEAHVRGLTMKHPEVPESLRGTYAGIAHPVITRYLRDLGITALELLPVQSFADDKRLLDRGLRNYWGYNTVGFFAPDVRYKSARAVGAEVREFKEMVKALHRAGIEVILDVAFNHSAEGNQLGPTFNLKGIDNPTYYRLGDDPRYYLDYTGTGNMLNVRHPQVLTLIKDALRYWAVDMHVDGFRFDLASSLMRQLHEVDQLSGFFSLLQQSRSLSEVKLIAEPWDLGPGGYQVGNFPMRWAEWNDRYRDAVRGLWRGDGGKAGEIGYRLTGSSDLYESSGRRPTASINLISAHDGFTLTDLVSYEHKHNEANGEDNRDGRDGELAWNSGVEGPSEDERIVALRRRQRKNLMATLLLSQGTPMIVAGDEFGRTQRGNNNAYCQDNELSWLDWNWAPDQRAMFEFTKWMLGLRRDHPALHRSKFFQGRAIYGTDVHDIAWFRHDGQPMSTDDWNNPSTQSLVMFLAGRGVGDEDEKGRPLVDDNLLIMLNASGSDLSVAIPQLEAVREPWQLMVDTADDAAEERRDPRESTTLVAHSLKFFQAPSRVVRTDDAMHTLGATYRVQLGPTFGFQNTLEIVDYIADLGITDLYASPLVRAVHGSTHGYDVVDHGHLNEELGTNDNFIALSDRLKERKLGLLLDWVPNHMGIAPGQNPWWDDVLENGPSSIHAEDFDIDWVPPKDALHDRVLLPILGDQYGAVLEKGELRVVWEKGAPTLSYYEKQLPLGPKSLILLLEPTLAKIGLREDDPCRQELESILSSLRHLPDRHATAPDLRKERAREKEVIKRRLSQLLEASPEIRDALKGVVENINGTPGVPTSFDALDEILQAQSYRLASWRVAAEEINYRRFFDVNDFAAIRMESPPIFDQAHALIFKLLDEGRINALRLDHTDGLYDPYAYFENLQRRFHRPSQNGATSPDDAARPLPVLVEKILEPGEQMPERWPVDGTTGYEFGTAVRGLWIDPRAQAAFTNIYQQFTGDRRSFAEHVYESKGLILRYSLASEVNMLARNLERIANSSRQWSDFTLISLTRALSETVAAFPVYRTYFRETEKRDPHDESCVKTAIATARRRIPSISESVFAFLEDLLLLRTEAPEDKRREQVRFALRFQQLTGPVMAKSVEDTAFYRYTRLVSLNEVGGMPSKFGTTLEEFHRQNADRARSWPLSMTTTSTHDTKRGEDTAARISVLTEMPNEWRRAALRWSAIARAARGSGEGETAPSPVHEYLLFQTLVGAWPCGWDGKSGRDDFVARLEAFLIKSAREGKDQTSWTNPNGVYEDSLKRLLQQLFASEAFIADARRFSETVAPYGAANGLAQCLLRLCAPGIPDTYQGAELWDQSLVDPDNRRPVDFDLRRRALREIKERINDRRALARDLLQSFSDGRIKLYLLYTVLGARRDHRDLFLRGDYEGLPSGENVVAFSRSLRSERLICCTARLSYLRTQGTSPWLVGQQWGNERLRIPYGGKYRNLLTGVSMSFSKQAALSDVFADLPVALWLREGS
jgi:glycogen debranching enzyme GlgX/malto-oligosyltrehalose synthase